MAVGLIFARTWNALIKHENSRVSVVSFHAKSLKWFMMK
jgi:hypothetical protein